MANRLNPFALEVRPIKKQRVHMVHELGQEIDVILKMNDNASVMASRALLVDVISRYVPRASRTPEYRELPERGDVIRMAGGKTIDITQVEFELACTVYCCQCPEGAHVFSVEELAVINRVWPEAISEFLVATSGIAGDDEPGNLTLADGGMQLEPVATKEQTATRTSLSGQTSSSRVSTQGSGRSANTRQAKSLGRSSSIGSKTRAGCKKTKAARSKS